MEIRLKVSSRFASMPWEKVLGQTLISTHTVPFHLSGLAYPAGHKPTHFLNGDYNWHNDHVTLWFYTFKLLKARRKPHPNGQLLSPNDEKESRFEIYLFKFQGTFRYKVSEITTLVFVGCTCAFGGCRTKHGANSLFCLSLSHLVGISRDVQVRRVSRFHIFDYLQNWDFHLK